MSRILSPDEGYTCVVIRWSFMDGLVVKPFRDIEDACRYATVRGGRVFGLNPEYEFSVTVAEKRRDDAE